MIKSLELQAIESGLSMRLVRMINDDSHPQSLNEWFIWKFALATKAYRVDRDGEMCNTGQLLNTWG